MDERRTGAIALPQRSSAAVPFPPAMVRASATRGPAWGALLVLALLAACHGTERPRAARPERGATVAKTQRDPAPSHPAPPHPATPLPGAALYRRYCALCHADDG